jgi:hypothetical protein
VPDRALQAVSRTGGPRCHQPPSPPLKSTCPPDPANPPPNRRLDHPNRSQLRGPLLPRPLPHPQPERLPLRKARPAGGRDAAGARVPDPPGDAGPVGGRRGGVALGLPFTYLSKALGSPVHGQCARARCL